MDKCKSEDTGDGNNDDDKPKDDATTPRSKEIPPKRTRTISSASAFMVPASPPKFLNVEEILQTADNMNRLALAHEITVDNNFRVENHEPSEESFEKRVKDTMLRAFWDMLEEQLHEDPPVFEQALKLLDEIKESLKNILLQSQTRMRTYIDEQLDMDLIKQQLKNNVLDMSSYADFLIGMMGRMCAPARDCEIEKLKGLDNTDIVGLYKEIFRVLGLMKMDMANFTIAQMRPYIQQSSVVYERQKFQEFLETQQKAGIDGLSSTRHWLHVAHESLQSRPMQQQSLGLPSNLPAINNQITCNKLLNEAYLDLLDFDVHGDVPFPEIVVMDESRILGIGRYSKQCVLAATIILVASSVFVPLQQNTKLKELIKDHCLVLLKDSEQTDMEDKAKYLADQVLADIKKNSTDDADIYKLTKESEADLLTQVRHAVKIDHPVHKLLRSRLRELQEKVLVSAFKEPIQIPQGLNIVKKELMESCGMLVRILGHNRNVFGNIYDELTQHILRGDLSCADSPRVPAPSLKQQ